MPHENETTVPNQPDTRLRMIMITTTGRTMIMVTTMLTAVMGIRIRLG